MGQTQSSGRDETTEDAPTKADYYELLGVERTASDDEIKKAYRRKALELHPDRNYGNVENATRLFAEIQSAYEVLSDPQERAWYDSHRDVLLRGDQGGQDGEEYSYNIRMTTADEVLKLMLKFNGRLEYSDSPSGFFGGLNDFFKKLAKEEDIACQWEDLDPIDYPDFGSKDDDYEDVVRPFYASWNGFATKKSFSWKDQYRLSDAPERRIRRLMEKENKKLRDEAIQEYNDAVRSLIAFVRKRDPRVQNNQKSEAERQKILKDAAAAQAARSRAARAAQLKEMESSSIPEWAQSRQADAHEGSFSSESDAEDHEYDCVVCDKTFKSEAQFHAHERSKKHIKLVKQLKKDMRKEGTILDLEPEKPANGHSESGEGADDFEAEQAQEENAAEQILETDEKSADGVSDNVHIRKSDQQVDLSENSEETDDEYAPRSAVEERLVNLDDQGISTTLETTNLEGTPATSDTEGKSQPKLGKAKLKRAKKAAQQAAADDEKTKSGFKCAQCQAEFPSKTKLFEHINKMGHAAPVSQVKSGSNKAGKSKKR